MAGDDLFFADLLEVSGQLRRCELSAVDLTEQMLERIRTVDAELGAYAFVSAEQARVDADRAHTELSRGHWRGPLHGVPIAVKDVIDTAGIRTEAGMKIREGRVPATDATCVARLRTAGAVMLGKTITSEAAFIGHSHRPAPHNPWCAGQSSGVSSSGSGVAVAAGLCYAALGTDTGGSIRLPSTLNGVTGLKPTWGRVSRHGALAVAPQFDVIGPMTRSAADAAAVLQIIAGADAHDPGVSTRPVPDYLQDIDRGLDAVRIGIDERFLAEICDNGMLATLIASLQELEALGARQVPLALPVVDPWVMLKQAHAALASGHRDTYPARADEYGEGLRQSLEAGRQLTAIDLVDAVNAGHELRARMDALFDHVDLLLMPAIAAVVQPVNPTGEGVDMAFEMKRATVTMAFSITGHPTITFPAGIIEGLPVGIQLVARHFDECLLLRTAQAWQRHTDYHRLRPAAVYEIEKHKF